MARVEVSIDERKPGSSLGVLPFDVARCEGHVSESPVLCDTCRRKEPGRPELQAYIAPMLKLGICENHIKPMDRVGLGKRETDYSWSDDEHMKWVHRAQTGN